MGRNPFLDRQAARADNDHGSTSEKRVAKAMGSRLTPASGALARFKSDATMAKAGRKYQIESKSTDKAFMRLDLEWLAKVAREAMEKKSTPVLTLSFVRADGKSLPCGDWAMMPLSDFNDLTE